LVHVITAISSAICVSVSLIICKQMDLLLFLFIIISGSAAQRGLWPPVALQPSAGYGLLVSRGFLITHDNAPQLVGLLWTSDQLVTETST
jgi:hypothetical protein